MKYFLVEFEYAIFYCSKWRIWLAMSKSTQFIIIGALIKLLQGQRLDLIAASSEIIRLDGMAKTQNRIHFLGYNNDDQRGVQSLLKR
jgi:hypothetical protein